MHDGCRPSRKANEHLAVPQYRTTPASCVGSSARELVEDLRMFVGDQTAPRRLPLCGDGSRPPTARCGVPGHGPGNGHGW